MGKLKRARQKFHLSRTRALDSTCTDKPENFQITTNNTFPLDSVPENIFSAIEISPEDLKQKLPKSDARSVVSSRSSSVKKPLLKKEKIKLRHELFIKKLEVVNQLRKEAKQKRKKKQPKEKAADVSGDLKSLLNSLPSLQTLPRQKQPISKVKKSCPKMKERQKTMLQDISVFKKILGDPLYKADPTGTITSHIQDKILQGAL